MHLWNLIRKLWPFNEAKWVLTGTSVGAATAAYRNLMAMLCAFDHEHFSDRKRRYRDIVEAASQFDCDSTQEFDTITSISFTALST